MLVGWPPCELDVSCASTTAESRARVWCQWGAFRTPGGLGCCPFWGGCSVVVAFLCIVTPIVGVCNCSMFCCALLCVHSNIAVVLVGRRELFALLGLSS